MSLWFFSAKLDMSMFYFTFSEICGPGCIILLLVLKGGAKNTISGFYFGYLTFSIFGIDAHS